jgi:hypothetical protein
VALIVLGRHGRRHRFPRRSVTRQVAARSHRPVAVAGFGETAPPGPSAARVVVAVDCVHDTSAAMALLGPRSAQRTGTGSESLSSPTRDATSTPALSQTARRSGPGGRVACASGLTPPPRLRRAPSPNPTGTATLEAARSAL